MIRKLTDREHILHRPSMYIGGIKDVEKSLWIMENDKFIEKTLKFNPGLLKIFYEILDNSIDAIHKTNIGDTIKIDLKEDHFLIEDNSSGIPVVKNSEGVFLPELAWGHARAGSNFEDRNSIGMNGIGSYLTNVYSTKFIGETCDGKKKFKGVWKDNAKDFKHIISACSKPGTLVTCFPDFERFGRKEFKNEIEIIKTRLYIIKYTYPNIKIKFNGETIKNLPLLEKFL